MPRRTLSLRLLTAATLLACAPGGAQGQGANLLLRLPGFERDIVLDTLVYARETVDAPRGAVLAAVREVYASLKLPKAVTDTLRGTVHNTQFSATTLLAGERISTYLRCGAGPSGENADYFRVTMAIATFVDSTGAATSRLGTGFVASARDMGGAAKPPSTCASTGLLEARIARLARERVAGR